MNRKSDRAPCACQLGEQNLLPLARHAVTVQQRPGCGPFQTRSTPSLHHPAHDLRRFYEARLCNRDPIQSASSCCPETVDCRLEPGSFTSTGEPTSRCVGGADVGGNFKRRSVLAPGFCSARSPGLWQSISTAYRRNGPADRDYLSAACTSPTRMPSASAKASTLWPLASKAFFRAARRARCCSTLASASSSSA